MPSRLRGLYAGYRYYETRYYDSVAGTGNATSPVGAYGSTTEWNLRQRVTYGFGYGLSPPAFDLEMQGQPTFDVTVDPGPARRAPRPPSTSR